MVHIEAVTTVREGTYEQRTVAIRVWLEGTYQGPVELFGTSHPGTAQIGRDTYNFNWGMSLRSTEAYLSLGSAVIPDFDPEGDETFGVSIDTADGATIGNSFSTVTIVDDDCGPTGPVSVPLYHDIPIFLWSPPLDMGTLGPILKAQAEPTRDLGCTVSTSFPGL